ncbi:HpcH/HpaI aldolase family protein [Planctomicrobium sp. SH661]|uniref:HpcH/HpaI aldolase family protein n=1 Tax=Planctomicrobium sp. SH661 TaxID=3448124 RepID=UPI003F5B6030
MVRCSRVLANLKQGLPTLSVVVHGTDPAIFEMVSLMGFAAIWLDLEHHAHSVDSAANLIRAARVGNCDVIARPGKGEFMRMSRLLEAGASGIMYPRCESAKEAAEVVRWAKFAPLGQRGFDGSGPDVPYLLTPMADYLQHANQNTFIIIQIEDPQSLNQIDEILAVPGIDMVMLGPADFSVLTGIPGQFGDSSIRDAIERVSVSAKKAGKNWAATCGTLAQAQAYIEMGARLVFHGCDIVYLHQGFDALRKNAAEILGMRIANSPIGGGSYLEKA